MCFHADVKVSHGRLDSIARELLIFLTKLQEFEVQIKRLSFMIEPLYFNVYFITKSNH